VTDCTLRVGLVQMNSEAGKRDANVAKAMHYIDDLAGRGAPSVVLPEFFNYRGARTREPARRWDIRSDHDGPCREFRAGKQGYDAVLLGRTAISF
jgi:predicted amidohydrolase